MTKIERAARAAHEVNKAYCETLGDFSQVSWEAAPDWQKRSAIAGVEALLEDPSSSPEKKHEGWLSLKLAEGWVYGAIKDPVLKTHPCCVPYSQLPSSQRAKDAIYGAVVRAHLSEEM